MSLYLKDPEVDRLARQLARLEGTTITDAVGRALRGRHALLADARTAKAERVEAQLEALRRLEVVDPSDPDAAIYDELGLPKT
jgi:antitoxin VapB